MTTYVLLIPKDDTLGNGLASIRERESELIDISAFEDGFSDSTSTTTRAFIIKDNKVYGVIKNFFDLDKNCRIYLAKESDDPYNKWPLEESK